MLDTKIYSPDRKPILDFLSEEKRLTARQITKLLKGSLPLREPSPKDYDTKIRLLNRMANEGLINKLKPPHETLPIMWSLPPIKREHKLSSYDHEHACADVYVALKISGKLEAWEWRKDDKSILYDRKASFLGKDIRFEIERGNHDEDDWHSKVERYKKLTGWFYVVFVMSDENSADRVTGVLKDARRNNQFLVTLQEYIAVNPLAEIFVSPLNPSSYQALERIQ